MLKLRFMQPLVAALVMVSLLLQGTLVLAGTTGGLNGTVTTAAGAPVSGAKVTVASPSQIASTTTDATGHFQFLNLSPDTYTLSAEKEGFNPLTLAGVTVTSDQNATVGLKVTEALKTIGRVSSRSSSDIVRPGLTTDVYSVNASAASKAAALGGGASQDSSYSAIQSVPGVVIPQGSIGWNQSVHIRGAASDTTGFEYDGIPVNRAFDNYAAHTASNLGQQELQVYTGGGPASSSSAGISGFINDVIKTGTYPSSGTFSAGVGDPAFYHQGKVELSGATENRNFSYYLGFSGYDQSYRYGDQFNGASLSTPFAPYASFSPIRVSTFTGQGVAGVCDSTGAVPAAEAALPSNAGCFVPYNGFLTNLTSDITDRENVINLHFAVPHKNGLKDDIQLLGSSSALRTQFYSSPNDLGPGVAEFFLANTGTPYIPPNAPGNDPTTQTFNYPHYADIFAYDAPFGTPVSGLTPKAYFQPSSPQNRSPFAPLPVNNRDLYNNDTGIAKLQYTHNFSDRLYARVFGYTFFSDWTQAGANNAWASGNFAISSGVVSPNYDLITHTAGASLQIGDQINDQNLVQLSADFVKASVVRFNNTGFLGQPAQTGLISKDAAGQYHCFSAGTQAEVPCYKGSYKGDANIFPAFAGSPTDPYGGTDGTVSGAAAAAGASWQTIWDGNADGTYNRVAPRFNSISLTDQFKPNSKLTINAGLRFDNYRYNLANTVRPADDFYTQIVQKYACYDPLTNTVNLKPLSPTTPPPPGILFTNGACASQLVGGVSHQFVHPDGTVQSGVQSQLFTDISPNSYTLQYFSPRVSLAYTVNADTVLRGSVGRFAEPPISAAVQYDRRAGRAATSLLANSFIPLGFFSPFHAIQGQTSMNADFSLEHHFHGSDLSFKASPFYRSTSNWSQDVLIGQNFVTHIPVGSSTDVGLEFALQKGNFDRNGFSGSVAYTYTDSKVKYRDVAGPGTGQISRINQSISQYNALTKSAPCYTPATTDASGAFVAGTPDATCASGDIQNPYFGKAQQALLDPNGSYAPYSTALAFTSSNDIGSGQYTSPHVVVAILNFRHEKFAITPSVQFATGNFYGSPTDVTGLDPRTCTANSATAGYPTAPSPLQADYTSCAAPAQTPTGALFIPNPETGSFDTIARFQQPSQITANVNLNYAFTKTVTANLLFSNIYHNCFGGTQAAWSRAFSPNSQNCQYTSNPYYAANFYNGKSANDTAANGVAPLPALSHAFSPLYSNQPLPFNVYGSLQIKL